MAASRIKSVSFKDDEKELLEYAEEQGNFSEYVKTLIKNDKEKGFKFTKEQEKAIVEIIKKYAPGVKEEDLKKDFDEDAKAALGQFDNM
jgi:guanylate kinase